jgi:hypothetical protein
MGTLIYLRSGKCCGHREGYSNNFGRSWSLSGATVAFGSGAKIALSFLALVGSAYAHFFDGHLPDAGFINDWQLYPIGAHPFYALDQLCSSEFRC